MSTIHENIAYHDCDCSDCSECGRYHEDIACMRNEAEMKEAYDAALRRQGAKEALDELKLYLLVCGIDERCNNEIMGIKWAVDAIDRRLSDLELTPEVGGAVLVADELGNDVWVA